jgi:nicotinamidase-related amidase
MKRAANIDIPQTLKEVCDPRRLALVVYDMQIGILKQLKDPEQIVGRVAKVLGAARRARPRVLHAAHVATKGIDGRLSVPDGNGVAAHGRPQGRHPMVPA